MNQTRKASIGFMLAGIAAGGRALLGVPNAVTWAMAALTILALAGYLLLCRQDKRMILCTAGQFILELLLCAALPGRWSTLLLRIADLWLLSAAGCAGVQTASAITGRQALRKYGGELPALFLALAAGQSLLLLLVTLWPDATLIQTLHTACFLMYCVLLMWYALICIWAYKIVRSQK